MYTSVSGDNRASVAESNYNDATDMNQHQQQVAGNPYTQYDNLYKQYQGAMKDRDELAK